MHFVGIDVSKETLDVVAINSEGVIEQQLVIENTSSSLKKVLKGWSKKTVKLEQSLFCLEPTGHYSNITVAVLLEMRLSVWVLSRTTIALTLLFSCSILSILS